LVISVFPLIFYFFGYRVSWHYSPGVRSPEEKKEQVWKRANGKGKHRWQPQDPEDMDSVVGCE
jgi:hypothetical protein